MPDIATCKNGAFLAPLEFDPGDRWQYGISMDWIGKLVEAVSDQSLEVYFRLRSMRSRRKRKKHSRRKPAHCALVPINLTSPG
jgi:hypothetical protein